MSIPHERPPAPPYVGGSAPQFYGSGPRTYQQPWYQPAQPAAPVQASQTTTDETPLLNLSGITITPNWVITPAGRAPRSQCRLAVAERVNWMQSTPTWAIVLAILGFFVVAFLSLFFLLAKEQRVTGIVDVTVSGPGLRYSAALPVVNAGALFALRNQIAYAHSLLEG